MAVDGDAADRHLQVGDAGAEQGEGLGGGDDVRAEVIVDGVGGMGAVGGDEGTGEEEEMVVEVDRGVRGGGVQALAGDGFEVDAVEGGFFALGGVEGEVVAGFDVAVEEFQLGGVAVFWVWAGEDAVDEGIELVGVAVEGVVHDEPAEEGAAEGFVVDVDGAGELGDFDGEETGWVVDEDDAAV